MQGKAQGSLEYLLLIGGMVAVAAIAITMIAAAPPKIDPGLQAKCAAQATFRACKNKLECLPVNKTGQLTVSAVGFFKCAPSFGLAAGYAFEEGQGLTAFDSIGNNDGTLQPSGSGPAWQTTGCPSEGCLQFDGVDDYVEVSDSPELRLGITQTVIIWVNVNAYPPSWARFVGKGDAGLSRNYGLWIQNDGDILYQFRDTEAGIYCNIWNNAGPGDPANIALGSGWHQVVGTFDGTIARLYIDGSEVTARDYSGSIPATNAEPLMIGARQSGDYFNGTIDEVAIYSRALSPEEICGDCQLNAPAGVACCA